YRSSFGFNLGFHFGIYGWAGGGWGGFLDWNFVPVGSFGHHHLRDYCLPGWRLRNQLEAVPRGIITTDTRSITPARWTRPSEVIDPLRRQATVTRPGGELPDVSGFVARRRDLPATVSRTVIADTPERPSLRPLATRDFTVQRPAVVNKPASERRFAQSG